MTDPLVTVGIPLYRSARFVDNVLASIAAMPAEGVEILVSDRHLADDALQRIADATRDDPRVRCMAARDEINWVEHINLLMREARGRYWRLLPHDDYAPPGSLEALVEVMEADSTLLVAYAATRAEELSGDPKPKLDVREAYPDTSAGQVYGHALDLVGGGHFTGAFKGLIRLAPIRARGLFIRPNVDLIGSERLWLFALALVGRFRFVPESLYIKRYHPRSVHSSWQARARHRLGALRIMREYLGDLHPDNAVRRLAFAYLGWVTLTRLHWLLRDRKDERLPWLVMSPLIIRMPFLGRRVRAYRDRLLALRDLPLPNLLESGGVARARRAPGARSGSSARGARCRASACPPRDPSG